MRVYKTDGTYTEDVNDTEFGWYLVDIVVDEADEGLEDCNRETRFQSNLAKSIPKGEFSESVDTHGNLEFAEEVQETRNIELNPSLEQAALINYNLMEKLNNPLPSKDKLAELIKPCNPEAKMLLAIVHQAKYKSLVKEQTAGELLKTVNTKTTNFKFLLNEEESDISDDMYKEIINYHAIKEDSMLSLMMELILADIDCYADDIITTPERQKSPVLSNFVVETSDLGNSIHSSTSSKGAHTGDQLQVANRSNILSSIGLDWEDNSIRCFFQETCEMHRELAEIRKSFQESQEKVDDLLKQAAALHNDLRETQYLNGILHLLEGDLEKIYAVVKMAKKGQAVQLQTEVSNDEEWEKLLQRDGLIVVDVYSDWCGSCQGMSANLKKLKLEIGGDMLQLATAKCDNITPLERFRNKSEPTWMFISKGKMVNLMYGANAPKLTRLIIEELKIEKLSAIGEKPRDKFQEIAEMADIELKRFEVRESVVQKAKEKEQAKRAKEIKDRKVAECQNILQNLSGFGTVVVFPNARDKYVDVLSDLIHEAGLAILQTEKINITQEHLDEILYFCENEEDGIEPSDDLLNNQCVVLLIKPGHGNEIENLDEAISVLVYGEHKKPPGSENSPYQRLLFKDEENKAEVGIWVPPHPFVKATCLRLFFPKYASHYAAPPLEETPKHLAIVFDVRKMNEAVQIMNQYPNEIMHYGFFTTDTPEEATLIAKSLRKLEMPENKNNRTFDEKLVIQVTKRKSECLLAFAQLGPLYMSPNADEGERECQIFFPDDYAESLDEEDLQFEEIEQGFVSPREEQPEESEDEVTAEKTEEEGEEATEEATEEEGDEKEESEEADINDLFGDDLDIPELAAETAEVPESAA